MEWQDFCNNLKEILELKRYENAEGINFEMGEENILIEYIATNGKHIRFTYTKNQFVMYNRSEKNNKGLIVVNEKYYEVPIVMKNEYLPMTIRMDRISGNKYEDKENGIQYKIDKPSKLFWMRIIENKIKLKVPMSIRRIAIYERDFDNAEENNEFEIFDLLKILYRDCITLSITSDQTREEDDFEKLADAFIFNINYNTDIGIRQTYDFENSRDKRIKNRFRNENINEISPPKRIYRKELVEQYNMANIADDPFIQYLCYYHILEHFYESVYKDELIRIVKEQLTLPSFSIKREREIIKLINIIKDKIKKDKEDFDGDELESLELVIEKYVNIEELEKKIKNVSNELADYYDKKSISFSKGIPINFRDKDNLCKNVAKRIYFTRNALVHYKSNDLIQKGRRNI